MNSDQITEAVNSALQCARSNNYRYFGTFAIDQLKTNFIPQNNLINACIINTALSNELYGHWITLIVDLTHPNSKFALIFDSLGRYDIQKHYPLLYQYLNTLPVDFFLINSEKYQSLLTDSCGVYAIFFIIAYLKDKTPFPQILQIFESKSECILFMDYLQFMLCNNTLNEIETLLNDVPKTIQTCFEPTSSSI